MIILDAPPILDIADAQLLASASAASIFVVGAGEKKKGMIRAAMRRLQLTRIAVIGTVLTKFDPKSVGYTYGYGYGYGYGHGYLGGPFSYGYSGAPDDPKQLAKPTRN